MDFYFDNYPTEYNDLSNDWFPQTIPATIKHWLLNMDV